MYNMDAMVKRLLEGKEEKILDTSIFNIEGGSEESYDLLDLLDTRVKSTLLKFSMHDVDMDDSGLDGNPKVTPNRTITYRVQLYRYKNEKMLPLAKKEQSSILSSLSKTVKLPASDEEYDYSVSVDIAGTELSIELHRDESL